MVSIGLGRKMRCKMNYIIECLTISLPIILSALGVIIAIVALCIGFRIVKIEKQLAILEKHKNILIAQMVYFGDDNEIIKGRDALKSIKEAKGITDDYEAMSFYYNSKN